MRVEFGDYLISDDKELLDFDAIKKFLKNSYWANNRSDDRIERSVANSVCIGVYHDRKQIAFTRIVTDDATVYYLCDVFIDEEYRGLGIGKMLIETITESEPYRDLQGMLRTRDAHTLYEAYGFVRDPESFMRRPPNGIR